MIRILRNNLIPIHEKQLILPFEKPKVFKNPILKN